MKPSNVHRFELLDGLRGVAAIAVMLDHFTAHMGLAWCGGAWVSVDLFFILSGFVIAHSYGDKLLGGMSSSTFIATRMIRLAPLYWVGLLLGTIAACLPPAGHPRTFDAMQLATAGLLGAFWLPYFNAIAWPFGSTDLIGTVFPLNDPSWSLFFELFVNLAFFGFVARYRRTSSVRLMILLVVLFALCIVGFRAINPGWQASSFVFGFPRVLAGFFAGALMHGLGSHLKPARATLTLWVAPLCLAGMLIENDKINLLNSFTLVPLLVMLASSVRVGRTAGRLCRFLGDLSYPLYILHFPLYRLVWGLTDIERLGPVAQTSAMCAISLVVAASCIGIDRRVRTVLMSRLVSRTERPTSTAVAASN